MNIIDKAREHAFKAHEAVNHLYNGEPYKVHLIMAQVAAHNFAYLIPEEDIDDVVAGVLEHDTIEDCGVVYADLKKATNERVAELVYACTNEKGRTRAERANDKYYEGIRNTKYATFVKLCDRIANVLYSLEVKNKMIEMYKKEHKHFKSMLYSVEYDDMWKYLDGILTLEDDVNKYNI
jgi:(p)ppGpp synthase/HD superfamily hydrolase